MMRVWAQRNHIVLVMRSKGGSDGADERMVWHVSGRWFRPIRAKMSTMGETLKWREREGQWMQWVPPKLLRVDFSSERRLMTHLTDFGFGQSCDLTFRRGRGDPRIFPQIYLNTPLNSYTHAFTKLIYFLMAKLNLISILRSFS